MTENRNVPDTTGGAEASRSMLSCAWDLPNRYSLAGLACALLGIYFAIRGVFPAAMAALVWAVAFDWFDGYVARRMGGRSAVQGEYGEQMDSLIDVVSFGVAPAVLLLAVGDFSPWFLPGAVVVLGASVIRLAYFNVFGLVDSSTYRGLALDNNMILLVALFAFRGLFSAPVFAGVVYATLVLLAGLNLAPINTPKFGGKWIVALTAYAVVMSAVFGWQLLTVAV